MRQEHETAKSFNELKAIMQAIMLKKGALKNATNQANANEKLEKTQENTSAKAHTPGRTQASENANISDLTQQSAFKPKATAHAKKGRLNPTKKAFSERQITAFRDNSQASELTLKEHAESESNLKAEPSNKAFKPGLTNTQENQKGGKK